MQLIDTHAHIQGSEYDGDREPALERARAAGVTRIVVIGADMPTSEAALRLAGGQPGILATVGVHPHDAKSFTDADRDRLKAMAAHPRVRAIGEIGLDYHYDHSPRPVQRACFESQLALAAELGVPAVIHMREAEDDVFSILRAAPPGDGPVLMHCFLGGPAEAERWLSLGCTLAVGGAVTWKKMDALREAVRLIPLDRLLLETDCPYMAPHPHRGRRNEPAYIPLVAAAVAEAKGLSVEEVAAATSSNAVGVFGEW